MPRSASKERQEKGRKYASNKKWLEKQSAGFSASFLRLPKGASLYQPKEGRALLDILPYEVGKGNPHADEGMLYWERTFYVHRNIGPNNEMFICPAKTLKKPCPVCEERARILRNDPDEDEQKYAKDLSPKERQIFNIRDRNNKEKGVQLFVMSSFNFGDVIQKEVANADEEDGWDNFWHLEGGKTLKVGFGEDNMGSAKFLKADTIHFKDREDLDEEETLAETFCLDDLLIVPEYKELKATFLQSKAKDEDEDEDEEEEDDTDTDSEDEEEEEEAPKKKGKSSSSGKKKSSKSDSDDDEDEEEEEEGDDEGEDEEPARKSTKKSKSNRASSKDEDEEEEEESDDEEGDDDDSDDSDEDEEEDGDGGGNGQDDEENPDDEDEEEEEEAVKKSSKKGSKPTKKQSKRSSDSDDESDDEDEEDEEEESDDEDEEDDDAEETPRGGKFRTASKKDVERAKKASDKRKSREEEADSDEDPDWDKFDDDSEEEEEEEPAPKKKKSKK